jgi:hypothetical protein
VDSELAKATERGQRGIAEQDGAALAGTLEPCE